MTTHAGDGLLQRGRPLFHAAVTAVIAVTAVTSVTAVMAVTAVTSVKVDANGVSDRFELCHL